MTAPDAGSAPTTGHDLDVAAVEPAAIRAAIEAHRKASDYVPLSQVTQPILSMEFSRMRPALEAAGPILLAAKQAEVDRLTRDLAEVGRAYATEVDRVAILHRANLAVTRERDDARRLVGNVEALHTPETRWQTSPDAESSWDTAQDALDSADYERLTEADLHTFQVCSHCGALEMLVDQCEDHAYQDSLWPCATKRALAGDADRPDIETAEGEES